MYPAHWIRVSDADREAVVAHLSAAAAEGRLTLDEFSERTQLAYAARTWGELTVLVSDLPVAPPVVAPAAAGPNSGLPLLALISGIASIPAIACMPFGGVVGVLGIVLGILALRTVARGVPGQRGMALTGVVCGSLGVAAQAAMMMLLIVVGD
jgi:hypothetical protein